jgi:hypothetical protein
MGKAVVIEKLLTHLNEKAASQQRACCRKAGHRRKPACLADPRGTNPSLKWLHLAQAVGHLLARGQELVRNGRKAGKSSSRGGRIQQEFAAIRAQSEANGCSITVDFTEKGFCSSYTLRQNVTRQRVAFQTACALAILHCRPGNRTFQNLPNEEI